MTARVCVVFVALFALSKIGAAQSTEQSFSATWQLLGHHVENDKAFYSALKITNHRETPLGNAGWAFYFSRHPSWVLPESVQGNVNLERISGGLFRITPKENFQPLATGETATILYASNHPLAKTTDGAGGGYFLMDGSEDPTEAIKTEIKLLNPDVDIVTLTGNQDWIVSPEQRFDANEKIISAGISDCPITPTPMSFIKGDGEFELDKTMIFRCPEELAQTALQFQSDLEKATGIKIQLSADAASARKPYGSSIEAYLDADAAPESYQMRVWPQGIEIRGDAAGVFYATQNLIGLADVSNSAEQQTDPAAKLTATIKSCTIKDQPRFAYRGLHIDVARNFHSKTNLLQIIDQMAFYKLNKLHLHLCDDEGWRVEIAGLPELTEIGGRRGHTVDESDRLFPAYGSGPVDDANPAGTGFYSRVDFIQILKYATERHIEVIPEIDLPGHARAAIVAMNRRYDHFMEAGDEESANEFLLSDPNDQSKYWSIQYYNDNVLCPAQPGVYRFFTAVVDDMKAMYKSAGAELSIVHTGGDEVPAGVWQKSPLCQKLISENDELKDATDLSYLLLEKLADILEKRDIQLAGWEEIALKADLEDGHKEKVPNPDFAERNFVPYIWNSVVGWKGEELGYKLANAGYPVVLCNADHLYLSLSPVIDTDEPGYFWAGLVTMKTIFEFTPLDIYKSARTERNGKPVNRAELFAESTRLTESGRKNVLGIQGEIWSETLRNETLLKDRLYPKIVALAERAWSPQPKWAKADDLETLDSGSDQAFAKFSNRIDRYELPRFTADKIGYHLDEPGVKQADGKIMANVQFPYSQTIRYTTDGTQPTAASLEYTMPIPVAAGKYRFVAFSNDGRSSGEVVLEVR